MTLCRAVPVALCRCSVVALLTWSGACAMAQPSTAASDAAGASAAERTIRISGAYGGTDFSNASVALRAPWKHKGGDYVDRNGVPNGPTPHASAKVDGVSTLVLDISGIDGDIFLHYEGGYAPIWSAPLIDGAPAEAFWTDESSARPLGPPLKMPAFIPNPRRGKQLTLRIDAFYRPGEVRADKVDAPRVDALPMVRGGLAAAITKDTDLRGKPGVIRYLELRNEATVRALNPKGTIAEPFAFEPQWIEGPNRLPVLRFASHPTAQRLISWFLRFEPRDEAYARYCIFIEDDVADGMNELGVKLPGLAGDEVSWRMEHGPIAPANRGLYAAVDYIYAADTGSGYGAIRSMNAVLQAGRWYTIEQYAKMNTAGNADGIGRVWINGHLTWESKTVRYRNNPASKLNHVHVNVYHGGMGLPKGPLHYRIAAVVVADSYIGPPPELFGTIEASPAVRDTPGPAAAKPPPARPGASTPAK